MAARSTRALRDGAPPLDMPIVRTELILHPNDPTPTGMREVSNLQAMFVAGAYGGGESGVLVIIDAQGVEKWQSHLSLAPASVYMAGYGFGSLAVSDKELLVVSTFPRPLSVRVRGFYPTQGLMDDRRYEP